MVIENRASPLLVRNLIHEGRSGGVLIRGVGTRGRLEDNHIWGTEQACVAIVGGADPTIISNKCVAGFALRTRFVIAILSWVSICVRRLTAVP